MKAKSAERLFWTQFFRMKRHLEGSPLTGWGSGYPRRLIRAIAVGNACAGLRKRLGHKVCCKVVASL